jgi:hypothetical protein
VEGVQALSFRPHEELAQPLQPGLRAVSAGGPSRSGFLGALGLVRGPSILDLHRSLTEKLGQQLAVGLSGG